MFFSIDGPLKIGIRTGDDMASQWMDAYDQAKSRGYDQFVSSVFPGGIIVLTFGDDSLNDGWSSKITRPISDILGKIMDYKMSLENSLSQEEIDKKRAKLSSLNEFLFENL